MTKPTLMITLYDENERQNAYVEMMPVLCLRCKTPLSNYNVGEDVLTIECTKCKLWHTLIEEE